ncbi:MAG: RHS repeat protein [Dehalococcoidia bacterium]|nr:RHS repeat protein [Dehalococcoidia bacterium]
MRDAEERIIQIMDGAGRSVGYAYDPEGNLATFTDVLGRDTRFEYNAPGHPHHLTDIIDWRGVRMAAIDYQPDGRMREMCDADGVCIEQQYDLVAQTVLRFTGLPAPTRYAYDTRGNINRIEDGLGNTQLFTYDGAPWDNLIERIDADGVTQYTYSAFSRDLRSEIPRPRAVRTRTCSAPITPTASSSAPPTTEPCSRAPRCRAAGPTTTPTTTGATRPRSRTTRAT